MFDRSWIFTEDTVTCVWAVQDPQNCDANYHDTLLVDGLVIKMHSTFNRWPKVE